VSFHFRKEKSWNKFNLFRWFFYPDFLNKKRYCCLSVELEVPTKSFGFSLQLGPNDIIFSFKLCPFFSLYISLEDPIVYRIMKKWSDKYEGRVIEFSIHDWTLWWKMWTDPHSWTNTTPKWKDGNFNILDFFFGRDKYTRKDLYSADLDLELSERTYKVSVIMHEDTWKRPRWPIPAKLIRADLEPDIPIPTPGKGENSWDCGEDATFSMTCQASTPEEAIIKLRDDILRDRKKYGGEDWIPSNS